MKKLFLTLIVSLTLPQSITAMAARMDVPTLAGQTQDEFGGERGVAPQALSSTMDSNVMSPAPGPDFGQSISESAKRDGRQFGQTVSEAARLGDVVPPPVSAVPIPPAAWLFGSALLGLGFIKRRKA